MSRLLATTLTTVYTMMDILTTASTLARKQSQPMIFSSKTLPVGSHFSGSNKLGVELVDETFRLVCLAYDLLLVVLADGATELVIVHGRSVLSLTPQLGHTRRVFDFENSYQHMHNSVVFCW